MIATRLELARDQAAVWARRRCAAISALYAYPIAEAPVVENVARQAKKI
jgi:hypothetical protein